MIHSTKRGQDWSFWGRYDPTIRIRKFFEELALKRPGEAREVAEADEFNAVVEVIRPGKSLLRTSESSRFLNSALF